MAESAPLISKELLDEFYAECDEHLVAIRHALSILIPDSGATSTARREATEGLFRSMHTLKGICAMVNLAAAESLAHASEDYLRDLSRGEGAVDQGGVDALSAAAHKLEAIIGAHRNQQPTPAIEAEIAAIRTAPSRSHKQSTGPAPQAETPTAPVVHPKTVDLRQRVSEALAAGKSVWECSFTPSVALDQRGINVNQMRTRLGGIGEILQAAPVIHQGQVTFQFTVSTPGPVDWSGWINDGLTAAPYNETPAAQTSARPETTPAVAGPATAAGHTPFLAPSHVVRVELARLDELMRIAGEMVVRRARLEEGIQKLATQHPDLDVRELEESSTALARDVRDMRDAIMRVRLVPAAEIFSRMPFLVRDLARETGKRVHVSVTGQETQIDKYIVERLKDPFLHLVRNSVGHGIESPEERRAAGKPEQASISLSAQTAGDVVIIRIADDGRGIDPAKLADRARTLGIPVPEVLDEPALLDLICSPGFSTQSEADRLAGRGVGMAVVATAVREMGGTVVLETKPGEGTAFTLRLPLTLAIIDAFIIQAGGQVFAVPQSNVEQIIQVEQGDVFAVGNARIVHHRGGALPIITLAERLGLPEGVQPRDPVLIAGTERGPVGLRVGRVFNQREVVVRALEDPLTHVAGFSGATDLGDGKPVLIIDCLALSRTSPAASQMGAI